MVHPSVDTTFAFSVQTRDSATGEDRANNLAVMVPASR